MLWSSQNEMSEYIHDSFVFSDQMGNKGAYIHLSGSDLKPEFHQFIAVVSGVSFLYIYLHSLIFRGERLYAPS